MPLPSESAMGPAMKALNVRQRRFVVALLTQGAGKTNWSRAAAMAGYKTTGNPGTIRVMGHMLANNPKVIAALKEEGARRLHGAQAMAVSTLIEIAENPTSEAKDRIKAAQLILDRTGLHATSEHKVLTQDVSKTDEAMIERIQILANRLGLDPAQLLGDKAPKGLPAPAEKPMAEIVEADYVEVSSEGLEDLL